MKHVSEKHSIHYVLKILSLELIPTVKQLIMLPQSLTLQLSEVIALVSAMVILSFLLRSRCVHACLVCNVQQLSDVHNSLAYLTACNRTGIIRLTDGANNYSGIVEYCNTGQYFSVCSMQGSAPEESKHSIQHLS